MATAQVWILLMSVYVAPPDGENWDGPWKHLMTMKMYDETQKFASKRECEAAGNTLKKKIREDGILAPHRIKCVSFDSTLPKGVTQ